MRPDPALVAALTREIMPRGLGVAAGDPARMPRGLHAEEVGALQVAVPHRIAEFHTGRAAARVAMAELSLPPKPILMGQDRAPVWPDGVAGSISHSKTACVAVVGRSTDWRGIGVDLEEATALNPLLVTEICTRAERQWLGRQPEDQRGLMAKLIFSAKESAYKAQYPVTRRIFGFETLELIIDRKTSRFEAVFQSAQGPIAAGEILRGRYAHAAGLLVTGVAIGHSAFAGSMKW